MELPLIERAGKFEWKFFDGATGRWEKNWKGPARPVLAECLFALDDGMETRCVFWMPPLVRNAGGAPQQPAVGPDGQPLPPGTPGVPGQPGTAAPPGGASPLPPVSPQVGTGAGK